jgi:nitrite reductase/ring-hydroxylating ferredoxin subunit
VKASIIKLDAAERARAERGSFVRVDLPHPVTIPDVGIATTVLVARVDGVLRAYANVCRHTAIPLDARGGTELGVMTEDGKTLFCDSHGAVYRPSDGLCTEGPCAGTHLFAFDIEGAGEREGEGEGEEMEDGAIRLTLTLRVPT